MFPQKNMIFDWIWSYSSDCCCCRFFCFFFILFFFFKKGKKSRPIQNRHYNRQSVTIGNLLEKYPGGVSWKIYTENVCKIGKKSPCRSLFYRAVALELETSLKIGLRYICFFINLRNFSGKVFWRILVP